MPEIIKIIATTEVLEYDGTNDDEAGSFYKGAQKVVMTGAEQGDLWIRMGQELNHLIAGPFPVGTVFLRNSENDYQYKVSSRTGINSRYMAVSATGELVVPFEDDPMS